MVAQVYLGGAHTPHARKPAQAHALGGVEEREKLSFNSNRMHLLIKNV